MTTGLAFYGVTIASVAKNAEFAEGLFRMAGSSIDEVSYFHARTRQKWRDAFPVDLHGRTSAPIAR